MAKSRHAGAQHGHAAQIVNAGDNSSAGMFPVCWCKSDHDHHKQDYHRMTDKEIAYKLARISAAQAANTDQALERILAGQ